MTGMIVPVVEQGPVLQIMWVGDARPFTPWPWWCGPTHRGKQALIGEPPHLLMWAEGVLMRVLELDRWLRDEVEAPEAVVMLRREGIVTTTTWDVQSGSLLVDMPVPEDVIGSRELSRVGLWLVDSVVRAFGDVTVRLGLAPPTLRIADPAAPERSADRVADVFSGGEMPTGPVLLVSAKNLSRARVAALVDSLEPVLLGIRHYAAYHCSSIGRGPIEAAGEPEYDFSGLDLPIGVDEILASPRNQMLICADRSAGTATTERIMEAAAVVGSVLPVAPRVLGRDGDVTWLALDWDQRLASSRPAADP